MKGEGNKSTTDLTDGCFGRCSLNAYFEDIWNIPPLSEEEEWRLVREKEGDLSAREELATRNLRFVVSVAKRYKNRGVPFEDLIQEGNMGLLEAVKRFDHKKGYRFSTYADFWIKQRIRRYIYWNARTIRLPEHVVSALDKTRRASDDLQKRLGREATMEELSWETGLTEDCLLQTMEAVKEVVFMDEIFISGHMDERNHLKEESHMEGLRCAIDESLETLSEREQAVIRLRFGLLDGKPLTLEEVGRRFNVTKERVRQIEAKALKKLRHPARSRKLENFIR